MNKKYVPAEIERKWQKKWKDAKINAVSLEDSKDQKKFYLLVEFTYPSGDLHMGHWFAFAVPDILARMKKMQGYRVFAPNGFDAFGLPAENAAIKRGIHPRDWTFGNIEKMKAQFESMGGVYDWEHQVITCEPDYYKWNQWIFLKMYEKGLAYRGKTLSNWCPKDQTVLANENVENGCCWRCGTEVVQKEVEQWFLKITDYADKLIWNEKNASVQWPKSLKEGQNNWIGKSEGTIIEFKVQNSNPIQSDSKFKIDVFTTRVDTLYGATFLVLAPEHPILAKIVPNNYSKQVKTYQSISAKKSEMERKENKEKTGVFTGAYAINPADGRQIPVWTSDYVLMGYGTGALFGDAHDERDVEFAKKYTIPLKPTLLTGDPKRDKRIKNLQEVLTGEGVLFDSGEFSGLKSAEARTKITDHLAKKGNGRGEIVYHLHDWSISRQRYWGTPIPIIHCENCGIVPVPEKDLPVELPYDVDFAPKGRPPLATAEDWVKVKCPNCSGEARREVETMDTFFDSSWYFLRYLDTKNNKEIANKKVLSDWMPVDIYFGGAEHTLGHTLYSRFFVKFLQDIGVVPPVSEYAKKRVHHGVILGPDGQRMSKSHGNVVNPDDEVMQYGADAVRLYLAFLGPYDLVAPWDPGGIRGVYNFLQRTWRLIESVGANAPILTDDQHEMHKAIKKVGEDLEATKFNTAVSTMMELLNHLSRKAHKGKISKVEYKTFLQLLAPFAPHITEELWEMLGENASIHRESWPEYDSKLAQAKQVTLVVQVNGRVRDKLLVEAGIDKESAEKLAIGSEKVTKFLGSKSPQKVIFIPDRLVNFVV